MKTILVGYICADGTLCLTTLAKLQALASYLKDDDIGREQNETYHIVLQQYMVLNAETRDEITSCL